MENNIYINTLLKKRVMLKPEYINKNYNKNIENVLKDDVGNKCIKEGYIKEDSINIIKRSTAKIISSNFSGDLAIDIIYSADICNPVRGNVIECQITRINKLGIQADNPPLSIIVAKQYHINKDIFKNLKIGQKIEVLVIGKRYLLNDKIIEIVGKLTTDKNVNKSIKIKKIINKEKELTDIFEPHLNENIIEGELENIDTESQSSDIAEEEEENVSDIDENISVDDDDDMLERERDEEESEKESEEEDVEEFD